MKTLILYKTKYGYTKKCAELLHSKIKGSDLFNIEKGGFILKNYDKVLIGSPLYIGELEERAKDFIERNKLTLLDRKLGLFCTGLTKEEFNIAVQDSLPADIFYHAKIVNCGGVIEYSNLTLKEKYVIWRRLKIRRSIKNEHLESLDELLE